MIGRLRKAPESFLSAADIGAIQRDGTAARRGFLRASFQTAMAGASVMSVAPAVAQSVPAAAPSERARNAKFPSEPGDPAILNLPAHSKGLGQPVAALAYGTPSKYEKNLQRRESPGLTRVSAASVAFTPLQGMFGIITASGLHFERHHQGWWDIDPTQHRLMINGLVKRPMVFTMDELMRMTPVSRIHFIECGANSGMEWGNVAVPTVQYTHGMLSCCEYTGVPLIDVLELCGANLKKGRFILAEGADGSSMTRTIPAALIESGEVLRALVQQHLPARR